MNRNPNLLKNRFIGIMLAKSLDNLEVLYDELCMNIDRLYENKHAQIVLNSNGSISIVSEHVEENCIPILSYDELSFKDDICYDIEKSLLNLENPNP